MRPSTRHSKITGNFGENLVLYELSKAGFECVLVDHTGIDIIAKKPDSSELMGISVKSRSRSSKNKNQYLSIHFNEFTQVDSACNAFGCVPYFAIVIDEPSQINMYLLSKEKLLSFNVRGTEIFAWKMTEKHRSLYRNDQEIRLLTLFRNNSKS
jgi:Holliday junction resolvase-like predicted endonuclease